MFYSEVTCLLIAFKMSEAIDPSTASASEEKLLWEHTPLLAFAAWMSSTDFVDERGGDSARPLRPSSARVYQSMFSKFCRFLLADRSEFDPGHLGPLLLTLQPEQIQAFLAANQLEGKGIGVRYLRLLERVFDRLGALQLTLNNPARQMAMGTPAVVAAVDDPKMYLTPPQQHAVLAALDALENAPRNEGGRETSHEKILRNRALVCLVLGAGLKVSAVLRLQLQHVSTVRHEDGSLWLEVPKVGAGRSHRTRLMPFAVEHVLTWHQWRSQWSNGDRLMFANSREEMLHPATVYRQVAAVLEVAGVPKHMIKRRGARTLRNSFAINELNKGTAEKVVGEYLGHRSWRSTHHYSALVRKTTK